MNLLENRIHATTRYPPGMLQCLDGHSRCLPQESVCIFDENLNGKTALCPFGLHLKNAEMLIVKIHLNVQDPTVFLFEGNLTESIIVCRIF